MSFKHKTLLISVLILSGCLFISGCGGSKRTAAGVSGQTRPSYMISVEELSSKLGLSMKKAGNPHFELSDGVNTVRLFTYSGGHAYVNGKSLGPVGKMTTSGGKVYVPELLESQIRAKMIPANPIRPASPTPWQSPRIYGSGVVVIDPGHGGEDPGAQSVLGYWEKDVNLKIGHKLASNLRDAGVKVVMTRESDFYPSLEGRAALANRENANLFVSIHCDSNGDRIHRGFTIYRARSASEASKQAGRILENRLTGAGIPSKGLRSADYKVLVQTNGPAVLVECGFMSNYDEAALLMDPWYQTKLARAIADGILEYL